MRSRRPTRLIPIPLELDSGFSSFLKYLLNPISASPACGEPTRSYPYLAGLNVAKVVQKVVIIEVGYAFSSIGNPGDEVSECGRFYRSGDELAQRRIFGSVAESESFEFCEIGEGEKKGWRSVTVVEMEPDEIGKYVDVQTQLRRK